MSIIITYDLSGEWTEVKTTMTNKGYRKSFVHEGSTMNMPETTLYHSTKTPKEAIEDIQAAATTNGVWVKRAISTQLDGSAWWALMGEEL